MNPLIAIFWVFVIATIVVVCAKLIADVLYSIFK